MESFDIGNCFLSSLKEGSWWVPAWMHRWMSNSFHDRCVRETIRELTEKSWNRLCFSKPLWFYCVATISFIQGDLRHYLLNTKLHYLFWWTRRRSCNTQVATPPLPLASHSAQSKLLSSLTNFQSFQPSLRVVCHQKLGICVLLWLHIYLEYNGVCAKELGRVMWEELHSSLPRSHFINIIPKFSLVILAAVSWKLKTSWASSSR